MEKVKNLMGFNISKSEVIYIHRGRNRVLNNFFTPQCRADYNFDYRGVKKIKILTTFFMIIKSFITALEVEKSKYYLLEGGMFIWIGIFLKLLNPSAKVIFNIADPTLAKYHDNFLSNIKYKMKIYLVSKFDVYITNSIMIAERLDKLYPGKKVYHYYLPLFNDKLDFNPIKDLRKDKVLFLITRPKETGFTKGLDVFLKLAKAMYAHNPSIQFILGGAGTKELDLSDYPNIVCYDHFYDVAVAYEMTRILIVPSFYDAYPCVSIECLAKGVIPIVSKGSGSFHDLKCINNNCGVHETNNIQEWIEKINYFNSMPLNEFEVVIKKGIEFLNKEFIHA